MIARLQPNRFGIFGGGALPIARDLPDDSQVMVRRGMLRVDVQSGLKAGQRAGRVALLLQQRPRLTWATT